MLKIATPISNLFTQASTAEKIINHSDCIECRDHNVFQEYGKEELFHCKIEPIHPMKEVQFEYLRQVTAKKKDLDLISFHMASACEDPIVKDGKFVPHPKRKKYSRREMLNYSRKNFRRIKEIVGTDIIICVENNNYYNTEAYRHITDPDFISQVVNENDIMFLFDIAHAKISAHNMGMTYEVYKSGLPLNRLIQIHISQHGFNEEGNAVDSHERIGTETYKEIQNLLQNNSTLKYLTVEYYKDEKILIDIIQNLRKFNK